MKLSIKEVNGHYVAASEDIECLEILAESVGLTKQLYVADEEVGAGLLKGLNKMQAQLLESAFKGRHRRAVVKWLEEPVEEKKEYIGIKVLLEDAEIFYMLSTWVPICRGNADINAHCTLSELKDKVQSIEEYLIASCNEDGEGIDYYVFNNGVWNQLNKKVELTDPPVVKPIPYSKPKPVNKPKKQNVNPSNSVVDNPVTRVNNPDDDTVKPLVKPLVNEESKEQSIPTIKQVSTIWEMINNIS